MTTPSTTSRVSVLLSAYNAESTLLHALESIQAQSFQDWELVIVDDGSRDATPDILKQFALREARARVITHERNAGLGASLNDALRSARGDLVARMDADDRSLPDRLQLQVDFLDAHPDIDILGGGAHEIAIDGTPLGELRRIERHEEMVARIYAENPFIHPTVMARREVLTRLHGYDPSCRRGQDYDLWLRAYPSARFHNLQQPLIVYTRRNEPSWRDARYSSRIVLRAIQREGRAWPDAWLAARPLAATAWNRVSGVFRGTR